MKSMMGRRILIAALMSLSACSYVKSWFPDKEKDYQYTTEIAPLSLPPDLTEDSILKSTAPAAGASVADKSGADHSETGAADAPSTIEAAGSGAVEEAAAAAGSKAAEAGQAPAESASEAAGVEAVPQTAETPAPETGSPVAETAAEEAERPAGETTPAVPPAEKKADKAAAIPVELVVYNDGESRLRIAAEPAIAWRMVGKALSRRSIEVIKRSQEERLFYVQYDPDEKAVEDGSLWDEVVFFFGGFQTHDKLYVLKLIENNRQTEVAVLDEDEKPVSNGPGLRLLKLIQNTIRADKAK